MFALSAVFAFAAFTSPAGAHADLTSSDPQDGATLTTAPAQVTLTFSEELIIETVEIAVTNSAGELVEGAVAETAGFQVITPWPGNLPGDTYKIAYRVVSNDGHPVTGSITFTYASDGTDAPEPIATQDFIADESAEPQTQSAGLSPIWFIAIGLTGGVAIGFFYWTRRPKNL